MEASAIAVHGLLAAAAFLQGVTGIGFALIAGPVLLLALNDGVAAPITALLTLAISVLLLPGAWRAVDRTLFLRFITAALLALPLGFLLFAVASPTLLKLIAGLVIGGLTAAMITGASAASASPGRAGDAAAGALGGALGGALSILGPPLSLRMTALGLPKAVNRGTVIAFFVASYPVVFAGQSLLGAGGAGDTAFRALAYAPATLLGAVAGQLAASRVSEAFFQRLVQLVLIAMAASLILDSLSRLLL